MDASTAFPVKMGLNLEEFHNLPEYIEDLTPQQRIYCSMFQLGDGPTFKSRWLEQMTEEERAEVSSCVPIKGDYKYEE